MAELPTVTLVFLVFNRREELRRSLQEMLHGTDYPSELIDAIVVDNASEDGSSDMVREEFPQVQLIRREENIGIAGWNDGFAVAGGELVMALDDDCYLPGDRLRQAVDAMRADGADLVSFGIARQGDDDYRFNDDYRTGLLSFWGCAVLMRREVLEALKGFDPQIFVWAHELEFMVRFFDRGFRHLHAPDIVAIHIKEAPPEGDWTDYFASRAYLLNSRHFAYIAAKHLRRREAAGAFVALLAHNLRDALRTRREAIKAVPETLAGFFEGMRRREPVSSAAVSRTYRRNFHSFASPWWLSRPVHRIVLDAPRIASDRLRGRATPKPTGRKDAYYAERARYYPASRSALEM